MRPMSAPTIDENRRAYLVLLSGVSARMSTYGLVIKGWGITLLAGLFVISRPQARIEIGAVLVAALALLWVLDGWIFGIEKIFRARYEAVRRHAAPADFALEPRHFDGEVPGLGRRMLCLSGFLRNFWIGLMLLAVGGALLLHLVID